MADLGFNVPVGIDPKPLEDGLNRSVNAVKNAGTQMGDAANGMSAKYNLLNKQIEVTGQKLVSLTKQYGESSIQALRAAAQIERYKEKLVQASQVTPVAARGFNGLNFSVAQLTREMPAFANSMQTGMMALSNNIPIFFDQIKMIKQANVELAKAGQPVKSVFDQVAASFLSWNTMLSVGVTLLTVYGAEIFKWVSGMTSANQEVNTALNNQVAFGIAIKNSTKEIQEQVEAIRERNRLLGIEAAALQQHTSKTQIQLNIERSRLSAMEKIAETSFKTKAFPAQTEAGATDEWVRQFEAIQASNEAINANREQYLKRIESQKALVSSLEKEVEVTKKIEALKTKPGSMDLAFRAEMNRKLFGPQFQTKGFKLDQTYGDGDPDKNNFGREAILKAYAYADEFAAIKERIQKQLQAMQDAFKNMAVSVGLSVMNGIGEGLATGEFDISNVTNMIANIANQLAASLAMIGIPLMAVPGMQGTGALYLAGAAALAVAAGAIGASGKGSASVSSGGTTMAAYSGGGQTQTQPGYNPFNYGGGTFYSGASGGGNLETKIRGNDILIIYKTSQKERRRL